MISVRSPFAITATIGVSSLRTSVSAVHSGPAWFLSAPVSMVSAISFPLLYSAVMVWPVPVRLSRRASWSCTRCTFVASPASGPFSSPPASPFDSPTGRSRGPIFRRCCHNVLPHVARCVASSGEHAAVDSPFSSMISTTVLISFTLMMASPVFAHAAVFIAAFAASMRSQAVSPISVDLTPT